MTEKWEIDRLGEVSLEELKTLIGYKESDVSAFSGKALARVYTTTNPVQGDYLVGILEQESIPALYQSFRDTAYDGIFILSQGYGTIITLEDDAYQARTIIEAVVQTIERESELANEAGEEEETDD
jgi:hypothetical protein